MAEQEDDQSQLKRSFQSGGVPSFAQFDNTPGAVAGASRRTIPRNNGGGAPPEGSSALPISIEEPASNITPSDYIFKMREHLIPHDNMAQTTPLLSQDKNIFWPAFCDWAVQNPVILQQMIYAYFQDESAWIFTMFPIKIDQRAIYTRNIIETTNIVPSAGVTKVPHRQINFRMRRTQSGAVYSGQGFSIDYHMMKTPDGMTYFDLMVRALTSNLWSLVILMALNTFTSTPTFYNTAERLFPYDARPETPKGVFDSEALTVGIFNKEPQAIHLLGSMGARVFEQNKLTLKAWIAGRGDVYFANLMDDSNLYTDKSGNSALQKRTNGDKVNTILDTPLYSIPYLGKYPHGGVDQGILEAVRQEGSHFGFYDNTLSLAKGEYTSDKRRIKACDAYTSDKTTYDFDDFLKHVVEFLPMNNECMIMTDLVNVHSGGGGVSSKKYNRGKINRVFLAALAKSADYRHNNKENIFVKTECDMASETNFRRLNPLLVYIGRAYSDAQGQKRSLWHPINAVGEMDEANCKTRYLKNSYKTMQHALEEGLTLRDRIDLQNGLQMCDDMNKPRALSGDAVTLIDTRVQMPYAGGSFARPNKFGGQQFTDLQTLFDTVPDWKYGFGNISGMMMLDDAFRSDTKGGKMVNSRDIETIKSFVRVYQKLIRKIIQINAGDEHCAISPKLIPFFHNNDDMNDETRSMIVAWYILFKPFHEPVRLDDVVIQMQWQASVESGKINDVPVGGATGRLPTGRVFNSSGSNNNNNNNNSGSGARGNFSGSGSREDFLGSFGGGGSGSRGENTNFRNFGSGVSGSNTGNGTGPSSGRDGRGYQLFTGPGGKPSGKPTETKDVFLSLGEADFDLFLKKRTKTNEDILLSVKKLAEQKFTGEDTTYLNAALYGIDYSVDYEEIVRTLNDKTLQRMEDATKIVNLFHRSVKEREALEIIDFAIAKGSQLQKDTFKKARKVFEKDNNKANETERTAFAAAFLEYFNTIPKYTTIGSVPRFDSIAEYSKYAYTVLISNISTDDKFWIDTVDDALYIVLLQLHTCPMSKLDELLTLEKDEAIEKMEKFITGAVYQESSMIGAGLGKLYTFVSGKKALSYADDDDKFKADEILARSKKEQRSRTEAKNSMTIILAKQQEAKKRQEEETKKREKEIADIAAEQLRLQEEKKISEQAARKAEENLRTATAAEKKQKEDEVKLAKEEDDRIKKEQKAVDDARKQKEKEKKESDRLQAAREKEEREQLERVRVEQAKIEKEKKAAAAIPTTTTSTASTATTTTTAGFPAVINAPPPSSGGAAAVTTAGSSAATATATATTADASAITTMKDLTSLDLPAYVYNGTKSATDVIDSATSTKYYNFFLKATELLDESPLKKIITSWNTAQPDLFGSLYYFMHGFRNNAAPPASNEYIGTAMRVLAACFEFIYHQSEQVGKKEAANIIATYATKCLELYNASKTPKDASLDDLFVVSGATSWWKRSITYVKFDSGISHVSSMEPKGQSFATNYYPGEVYRGRRDGNYTNYVNFNATNLGYTFQSDSYSVALQSSTANASSGSGIVELPVAQGFLCFRAVSYMMIFLGYVRLINKYTVETTEEVKAADNAFFGNIMTKVLSCMTLGETDDDKGKYEQIVGMLFTGTHGTAIITGTRPSDNSQYNYTGSVTGDGQPERLIANFAYPLNSVSVNELFGTNSALANVQEIIQVLQPSGASVDLVTSTNNFISKSFVLTKADKTTVTMFKYPGLDGKGEYVSFTDFIRARFPVVNVRVAGTGKLKTVTAGASYTASKHSLQSKNANSLSTEEYEQACRLESEVSELSTLSPDDKQLQSFYHHYRACVFIDPLHQISSAGFIALVPVVRADIAAIIKTSNENMVKLLTSITGTNKFTVVWLNPSYFKTQDASTVQKVQKGELESMWGKVKTGVAAIAEMTEFDSVRADEVVANISVMLQTLDSVSDSLPATVAPKINSLIEIRSLINRELLVSEVSRFIDTCEQNLSQPQTYSAGQTGARLFISGEDDEEDWDKEEFQGSGANVENAARFGSSHVSFKQDPDFPRLSIMRMKEAATTATMPDGQTAFSYEHVYDNTVRVSSMFAETQKDSIGGTLLSALAYVDAQLPMMNRGHSNPVTDTLRRSSETDAEHRAFFDNMMYTEEGYVTMTQMYPNMPDLVNHACVYPLTGNPEETNHCTDIESRFIESSKYPLMAKIAARVVLLTSMSLTSMRNWHDNNIAIPLGGLIMCPWSDQVFYSQIILADTEIGETRMSGFDNTVSFDPNAQHFDVQAFFHAAPMIDDPRKFLILKDTRGGEHLGGKGPRYINSTPDGRVIPLFIPNMTPEMRDSNEVIGVEYDRNDEREHRRITEEDIYSGQRLGQFSNIPVLQSYNTAVEKTNCLHFDIRGNWDPVDFAGRLDYSTEFVDTRDIPMYDGQFVVNTIFDLPKTAFRYPINTLSHFQKSQLSARNNHLHQRTQWVYEAGNPDCEIKGHTIWQDEYPGCNKQQSSNVPVSLTKTNVIDFTK